MKTKFIAPFVALVLGVSLVAASCSSDDDSTSKETTTTMEKSTTTADDSMGDKSDSSSELTIVDIAASNPDFSTLVSFVKAAGLAETLSGEGPFTVFAPTNEAFAKVPADTVAALKADPTGALADVLKLHVVSGKVLAADAAKLDGQCVDTLGGKVKIAKSGNDLTIVGQKIVKTDIEGSNGVIHVIDGVITAPSPDC